MGWNPLECYLGKHLLVPKELQVFAKELKDLLPISIKHNKENTNDLALVQAAFTDADGRKVHRTFISKLGKKLPNVQEASVKSTAVDETTGDLVITFEGVDCDRPVRIQARLAIEADGATANCVDDPYW